MECENPCLKDEVQYEYVVLEESDMYVITETRSWKIAQAHSKTKPKT